MLVKLYGMDHVGTRAEHLADLQDLWSFAYSQLISDRWHSEGEKHQAAELEVALDLLETHMQSQYRPTANAKVINELPKPPSDIRIT
jgi:hypothetical protein